MNESRSGKPSCNSQIRATKYARKTHFGWLIGVLILTALTYGYTLSASFVSDDNAFLVGNQKLLSASFSDYFSNGVWEFANIEVSGSQLYRPFALVNYRLQQSLWGSSPLGYHLVSLLSHLFVVVMVYCLLLRILPDASPSTTALATGIFAVHPIQVESVAWILGGNDMWATMWLFAAFLCYLHCENRKFIVGLLLLGIFSLASMLSKEVGFTAPALLCLILYAINPDRTLSSYIKPLGAVITAFLVAIILRNQVAGAANLSWDLEGLVRSSNYFLGYVKAITLPWPQRFYLEVPTTGILAGWEAVLALITLFWSGVLLVKSRSINNHFLIGALWILVVLSPALVIAFHAIRPTFANRLMYLALFGLAVIVQWLLFNLSANYQRRGTLIVGFIVLIFAGISAYTSRSWENQETFIDMALLSNPEHKALWIDKGDLLLERGESQRAAAAYSKSVERPVDRETLILGLDRLGEYYGKIGSYKKSKEAYFELISIDPQNSHAYNGLGNLEFLQGNFKDAAVMYKYAVQASPANMKAKENLNRAMMLMRDQ